MTRLRLGDVSLESIAYGQSRLINGVNVSFHPAGHLLGSSQIRIEYKGEIWVVTGDYKRQADPTCTPFEPIRCHTLITESTFALPVYRWPDPEDVYQQINAWWKSNSEKSRTSILFAYALGKAQRLLAGLDPDNGPILLHGAMQKLTQAYRESGIDLPETEYAGVEEAKKYKGKAIVIAPPSAGGSSWIKKFQPYSTAMASGWMMVRGNRRRRATDRGFVMSDHVDWNGLLTTIRESEADRVFATHGYTDILVRYLREEGREAEVLRTPWEGEIDDSSEGDSS